MTNLHTWGYFLDNNFQTSSKKNQWLRKKQVFMAIISDSWSLMCDKSAQDWWQLKLNSWHIEIIQVLRRDVMNERTSFLFNSVVRAAFGRYLMSYVLFYRNKSKNYWHIWQGRTVPRFENLRVSGSHGLKVWSKEGQNDRRNSGGTLRQKFNLNDIQHSTFNSWTNGPTDQCTNEPMD